MMKAKFKQRERTVVLIGLSHANLDRLRKNGLDTAIRIDGRDLGIGSDILITAAKDEMTMYEKFASHISADTKVHISEKLKS